MFFVLTEFGIIQQILPYLGDPEDTCVELASGRPDVIYFKADLTTE